MNKWSHLPTYHAFPQSYGQWNAKMTHFLFSADDRKKSVTISAKHVSASERFETWGLLTKLH